ncbi:hypothetical protein COCMIDRAFT_92098 [Bipolaris oryzae ATCC 44560]|uniref:SP-RING-type domain-containing protein n=1 Tax=Bipolaris oryzae ATCC 44560 TaxID=930090 RepID=W6ZAC2_COCMI|nr:uncharacterized protein COCMIDRAFT_92098 [Bipolaris oryzae ATCC 44560]EUC46728.1 hypothetical protein COCMIDRAFT_92098 [Bipolaris oryzae ATCC 44560]
MVSAGYSPAGDATAHTLHHALGNLGGPRKNWMLPSSAPVEPPALPAQPSANPLPFTVRGRGRPRKIPSQRRPSLHPVDPSVQSHYTGQPEQHPASNYTSSPQLANALAPRPSLASVLPSSTPSEDAATSAATAAAATITMSPAVATVSPTTYSPAASADAFTFDSAGAAYAPETPLEHVSMDPLQRRRPSHGSVDGHTRQVYAPHKSTNLRPAVRQNMTNTMSHVATDIATPNLPRRPSLNTYSQANSPIQRQAHSHSPSTLTHPPGQVSSPHLPAGVQFHHSAERRTTALPQTFQGTSPASPNMSFTMSPWYTTKSCLDQLKAFQVSMSALPSHSRDRLRFGVLRDATEKEDWFYLTIHQCYCMLTTAPEALPDTIKNLPGLPEAQKVLQDILEPNYILSSSVLDFFSNYPYPMQAIFAKWPSGFDYQVHLFTMFVAHCLNYEHLRSTCDQRRYPPLARELDTTLCVPSPIFQRLVFTGFLRYLWRANQKAPFAEKFEVMAVSVFQQNQVDYYRQKHESASAQSREALAAEQVCASKLRAAVEGYENALRQGGIPSSPIYQPHQQQLQHQQQQHQYQQHQHQQRQSNTARQPNANGVTSPYLQQHVVHQVYEQNYTPALPINTNIQTQPAPIPAQPTPISTQIQTKPPTSLLPPSGRVQPQQRVPNPARFSLHQAHLRSPVLNAHSVPSPLYGFQEGYVKFPARLSEPGCTMEKWVFVVTPERISSFPKTVRRSVADPGVRNINEANKIARLRCIKWTKGTDTPKEHVWATTDTSWIPYLYLSLNGTRLEARKKTHHGKDLAVDVTDLLREGENVLEMTVMAQPSDTSHWDYLLGIEAINIISHDSIKLNCTTQNCVSAHTVLDSIKQKLSGSSATAATDDDDDLHIVQSNMTINLREPFSQSTLCDTPVRSRFCLHNDCFDLDIFLRSRLGKSHVSPVDQWKCPICGTDARPNVLVHDGFIEHVNMALEARGLSETRQIVVLQDGTWRVKDEAEGGGAVQRRESEEGKVATPTTATAYAIPGSSVSRLSSIPVDAEVIDLSD